jgi:hypothetical protein
LVDEVHGPDESDGEPKDTSGSPENFKRLSDDLEVHMSDFNEMAETGLPIIEPMRTRKLTPSWDDILSLYDRF